MVCPGDPEVDRYARGLLSDAEVAALNAHLQSCSACQDRVAKVGEALIPSDLFSTFVPAEKPPPPPIATDLFVPGAEVDHFRIERVLGRGGMGEVYLARDTKLGRDVALKVVRPDILTEEAKQRFLHEARLTARFNHPNIVTVHGVGEHHGAPYVALEYIEGRSLRARMKERALSQQEILETAEAIAEALREAHARGVLHRDLKPDNVVIGDDGRVRVVDFGLATFAAAERESIVAALDQTHRESVKQLETAHGSIRGTPGYMAPERWRGASGAPPIDIWSLGVLLYELAAGKRPYDDRPFMIHTLIKEVTSATPAPGLDGRVSDALRLLVAQCLEKQPEKRPSAAEVVEALAQQLRSRPPIPPSPYRGLLSFDRAHEQLFFGRFSEISTIVERLRSQPFLVIAGRSGSGKSSLARAGLIPRISEIFPAQQEHRALIMVPGRRPFGTLIRDAAELLGVPEAELAAADPSSLAQRFFALDRGVLLVVDQLEELITLSEPQERTRFLAAFEPLIWPSDNVRVLCTVRSDFLGSFDTFPELREPLGRSLYILGPLTRDGLRDAIVAPARAFGFTFESERDVASLLDAASAADGSLPLLQFALAQLWELRDPARRVLPAGALDRIGGLSGALARHADNVLAGLPAPGQREARRILLRLITARRTRIRRTEAELSPAPETLEALVRGRLVVTGEDERGKTYELSHEALISGWGRLALWLDEEDQARVIHERLEHAAAEWDRLGRGAEGLWQGRQLNQLRDLGDLPLAPRERAFVARSVSFSRRRRLLRAGVPASLFFAVLATWLGFGYRSRSEAQRFAGERAAIAARALDEARSIDAEIETLRRRAFEQFDRGDSEKGEETWRAVLALRPKLEDAYSRSLLAANEALGRFAEHAASRAIAADVFADRLRLARRDHAPLHVLDALAGELALYDAPGRHRALLQKTGVLKVISRPPGAAVVLWRVTDADGDGRFEEERVSTSLDALAEGSYVAELSLDGFETARAPVLVHAAETAPLEVTLLREGSLPSGFVYIPGGPLLYGSRDAEPFRQWLDSPPAHPIDLPSFAIARFEVTIAEWIEFLLSLPPKERAARTPPLLRFERGRFVLTHLGRTLAPGEPFVFKNRAFNVSSGWLRWPVFGLNWESANAYAEWLSKRVPGARLCDEREWERAARGADLRSYPHGERLLAADANHWETYRPEDSRVILDANDQPANPDEVGSFPASRSVYGADDLAGNAAEWTASPGSNIRRDTRVLRGGSFLYDAEILIAQNRAIDDLFFVPPDSGVRICLSL